MKLCSIAIKTAFCEWSMLTLMRGQKLSRMSNMQKPFVEHSEEITKQKVAKCENSTRINSTWINSIQLNSTQLESTQIDSFWPNLTQLNWINHKFQMMHFLGSFKIAHCVVWGAVFAHHRISWCCHTVKRVQELLFLVSQHKGGHKLLA